MRVWAFVGLALAFSLGSLKVAAAPPTTEELPPVLRPWTAWVLHENPSFACPHDFNLFESRRCAWPSQLTLDVTTTGARFYQQVTLQTTEWITLPGDASQWPQNVRLDGNPAVVVAHNERPAVHLASGSHRLEGQFDWPSTPQTLATPADVGVMNVRINGVARNTRRDQTGALWLGQIQPTEGGASSPLKISVYRLVEDEIPPKLHTHLVVEAAGTPREVDLGLFLPAGLQALTLQSEIPVRIDDQGHLHVQARAGVWQIEIVAIGNAPLTTLQLPKISPPWPDSETWAYLPHPELRTVDLTGVTAIDPRQTQMPEDWKNHPAFAVNADTKVLWTEKQRGVAGQVEDQLQLHRNLWLDFDGSNFSVSDRIQGKVSSIWRLDAKNGLQLGQVIANGQPLFITQSPDGNSGVELRNTTLNMQADARLPRSFELPITGYSADFQSVEATLHLPPAWLLLAAPGSDKDPDSWIAQWSLLDLFLVLIATIASWRLLGILGGGFALGALVLSWHQMGALHWQWLNLLAVTTILSNLPTAFLSGKLTRYLQIWRYVALAWLGLSLIPFAIEQTRGAIYPALEPVDLQYHSSDMGMMDAMPQAAVAVAVDEMTTAPAPVAADAMQEQASLGAAEAPAAMPSPPPPAPPPERGETPVFGISSSNDYSRKALAQIAPGVLTQTGPGLPQWDWRSANLSWSGPITSEQTFSAMLLPPWATRSLRILMVAYAVAWLLMLAHKGGGFPPIQWRRLFNRAQRLTPVAMVLLSLSLICPQSFASSELPSPEEPLPDARLLETLKNRLMEAPSCLPDCAAISRLAVTASNNQLQMRLTLAAAADVMVPLPVPRLTPADQAVAWQPSAVTVGAQPAVLARNVDGGLVLALKKGVHEVLIEGDLSGINQLELPLPLAPRNVSASLSGFTLGGVDERGTPSTALQLLRAELASGPSEEVAQNLPPIVRIHRHITLNQDWELITTVRREGTPNVPVITSVTLLENERPVTDGLHIEAGKVLVSLAPDQSEFSWVSRLSIAPTLSLQAANNPAQFEQWQFRISPIWRVNFVGLPSIAQVNNEEWQPLYRPWPNETLKLSITRPNGVLGQTLTIDRTDFDITPSDRITEASLSFTLRASQGGPWLFALPEGFQLVNLKHQGADISQRLEAGRVRVNLVPGSNQITARLRADHGLSAWQQTPALPSSTPGVNAHISLTVPASRWLLATGGPTLGPAVLFWGVMAVWLVLAVAVGRLAATPLGSLSWLLLALGLSQVALWQAALVLAWFTALSARGRTLPQLEHRTRFNAMQAGLVLLTIAALAVLFNAVAQGLIGQPDMMVAGNQSNGTTLRWYQDRYQTELPRAWIFSVSIWVYRLLMLVWALWLAFKLLQWLRWAWAQFFYGGLWLPKPPKASATLAAEAPEAEIPASAPETASAAPTPPT